MVNRSLRDRQRQTNMIASADHHDLKLELAIEEPAGRGTVISTALARFRW
jgi:hypothetical protein